MGIFRSSLAIVAASLFGACSNSPAAVDEDGGGESSETGPESGGEGDTGAYPQEPWGADEGDTLGTYVWERADQTQHQTADFFGIPQRALVLY